MNKLNEIDRHMLNNFQGESKILQNIEKKPNKKSTFEWKNLRFALPAYDCAQISGKIKPQNFLLKSAVNQLMNSIEQFLFFFLYGIGLDFV